MMLFFHYLTWHKSLLRANIDAVIALLTQAAIHPNQVAYKP